MGLFVPFQVIMLPISKQMANLQLLNQGGLILLYLTYGLLQSVFLFVGYIRTVPVDVEEAAFIDGCNQYSAYYRIVFPMLKPMNATIVIMNGVWIWNDFLLPLIMLQRVEHYTLLLSTNMLFGQYSSDWPAILSALILTVLPVIILYALLQRRILSGIAEGALKG